MTSSVTTASRRAKIFSFSPETLLGLFEDGSPRPAGTVRFEGLPSGAKPIRAQYDFVSNLFDVVVTHDSFPEVPEGEILPRACIIVHVRQSNQHPSIKTDTHPDTR